MSKCKAITKKKKPCPFDVEPWRTNGLCHLHDPNGKFRQQVKKGEHRLPKNKSKGHEHTWYMREPGIQCTKCLIIWDKETDSASLDA
jgi:hypothetical protein